MDADHLDIYGDHKNIKKAFDQFSKRVKHKVLVAKDLDKETCCYALEDQANYRAEAIRVEDKDTVLILLAPPKPIKIFISEQWKAQSIQCYRCVSNFGYGGFPLEKFTCLVNL